MNAKEGIIITGFQNQNKEKRKYVRFLLAINLYIGEFSDTEERIQIRRRK
jgi:hypothetical protein